MKKQNTRVLIIKLLALLVMMISVHLSINAQDKFPRGEIIANVVCKDKPDQSYVLYLPKNYAHDKEWPIIFAFDPRARGKIPVELFQPAAEKYGYIVVGSNNSQNGPFYISDRAIFAMWQDTRQRFAIDSRRIYSAGFSGGARVAGRFHKLTGNSCACIIACGAGLPENFGDLSTVKPAAWYGIIGLSDFNYYELLDMDMAFDRVAVIHHVEVLDMEHRWPPVEDISRAVTWMEINAMKNNSRPKDLSLVQALYQEALTRDNNLELSNNIPFAVNAYDWTLKLFGGLLDVSFAEKKKTLLMESKAYKKFVQDETERRQKVANHFKNLARVTYAIEHPLSKSLSLEKIYQELQLNELQKEAKRARDIYDRSMAFRVLAGFGTSTYDKGTEYYQEKDYEKAILFFGIATYVNEKNYYAPYNLACAYSLTKQKKPALKALELAINRGFNNPDQIDKDKDLDFIRDEKAFAQMKQKMAQRSD